MSEIPSQIDSPLKHNSNLNYEGLKMFKSILRVTPSLWQKIDTTTSTLNEQKTKLVKLLIWFAKKNGWDVSAPVAQRYSDRGRHIAGRMSMQLGHDTNKIKIEVALTISKSAAFKLKAAHQEHARVVLITTNKSAKQTIALQLNEPADWLTVVVLD